MSEVLRLDGVSKAYNQGAPNEVQVLHDVSLSLQAGEVVALEAPSGAGKSTMLHIAGLLESASEGRVIVGGEEAHSARDHRRTALRRDRIGFIYQFHHLLPEFTARDNVILPQRAAGVALGVAGARADELLKSVGLGHRINHRPAELSGGEQQRVAFCRAMANSPDILLADEPTGNLDPGTSDVVFEAMMALVRDTGLAAIVATHNPELAARMDRRMRLVDGRLEAV